MSCYSSEKAVRGFSLNMASLSHGIEANGRLMSTNCFCSPVINVGALQIYGLMQYLTGEQIQLCSCSWN